MGKTSKHSGPPLVAPSEKVSSLSKRWLTIKEVAGLIRISRDTVERWVNVGQLRAFNVSPNTKTGSRRASWRIASDDLERFLEARANRPILQTRKRRIVQKNDFVEFVK